MLDTIKDHFIICGYGRIGSIVAQQFRRQRIPYVVIERSADRVQMAIDEGQILATGSSRPVSEIELELKHGSPADLFKVARDIVDIVPAHLEFKSKPDRGYELVEETTVAAETASNPELGAGTSTGRSFTLIGRACLRRARRISPKWARA
jgi:inorganic triphosphatase YgiF